MGIVLGILVLYYVIAMLFFDSKRHFEKSETIAATPQKIWPLVGSMKAFNTWNPWMKYDPNLKVTYKGNSGSVSDSYHWIGNEDVGEGEQTITEIQPEKKVRTAMKFIKPMEDEATSDLFLAPEGNGTKVTWTIDYEVETLFKPMVPLMDYQMNKSYTEGLANLKALAEK